MFKAVAEPPYAPPPEGTDPSKINHKSNNTVNQNKINILLRVLHRNFLEMQRIRVHFKRTAVERS